MAQEDTAEMVRATIRQEAVREAFAGSLRMQAGTLRSEGEAKLAKARELDSFAAAVERGEEGPPPAGMRVVMALAPDEPAASEEVAAGLVQRIATRDRDGQFIVADGGDFTPEMRELLENFDSRYSRSPHFVDAVNTAAVHGLPATPGTIDFITRFVRERED